MEEIEGWTWIRASPASCRNATTDAVMTSEFTGVASILQRPQIRHILNPKFSCKTP